MAMSAHIQRLRAALGPELLVLPSVTGIIFDDENRILFVRQTESGLWSTPAEPSTRRRYLQTRSSARFGKRPVYTPSRFACSESMAALPAWSRTPTEIAPSTS